MAAGVVISNGQQQQRNQSAEEWANSLTHGVGLVVSVAAAPLLFSVAVHTHDVWRETAAIVYALSLISLYGISTLYHAACIKRWNEMLQRADHSAIYLMIAGSYTPFMLGPLRGTLGLSLLASVWVLGGFGVWIKTRYGCNKMLGVSTVCYLVLGWMIIAVVEPLARSLGPDPVHWLIGGGLLYTAGVVCFAFDEKIRYSHAAWHCFVLAGSFSHLYVVYRYVLPMHG